MVKKRLKEIDVASGIAIILVVAGHLSDYLPEWYGIFKATLYKFHMPFFMFISGFLLYYSKNKYSTKPTFIKFIKSKFIRFGIPYIFMSLSFLIIKFYLGQFDLETAFYQKLKSIFIEPTSGPSIFLWYIYVLFLFYVIFPTLYLIPFFKNQSFVLVIVGLVFYFVNPSLGLFELDMIFKYFLFFSLGFIVSKYYDLVYRKVRRYGLFFFLLFSFLVVYDMLNFTNLPVILLGLVSLPSLLYVAILLSSNAMLQNLGSKTFVIYIWNSVFIFAISFLLKKIDSNYWLNFKFYSIILLVAGVGFPLILRYFSRKYNWFIVYKIIP